jgi:hypothetical protein
MGINHKVSDLGPFHHFDTAMSSGGVIQAGEGNDAAANLETTVANGDQSRDSTSPPETLTGEPHWRLQR